MGALVPAILDIRTLWYVSTHPGPACYIAAMHRRNPWLPCVLGSISRGWDSARYLPVQDILA
jgi:hypothetical protein